MRRYIPKSSPFQESLAASVKEGITAEVVIRALDYYIIPFALFLGATTDLIGLVVAIPNLAATLAILAVPTVHAFLKSRRKVLVWGIGLQTLFLAPLAFLALVRFPLNIYLMVLFVSGFKLLGTVFGPAWGSLMSDYLSPRQRGFYFGGRARIVGITGMIGTMLWGGLLHFTSGMLGFMTIFITVTFLRYFSFNYSRQMTDIEQEKTSFPKNPLRGILTAFATLSHGNMRRFTVYVTLTTFATQLVLPYFSVWMLKELGLNYLWYMTVHLASLVFGIIAFPLWGKHSDYLGNSRVLRNSSYLITFIPLLWIFARNHPIILIAVEMYSGFVWAGFNLCSKNFIYESCSSEQRVNCLVFYNVLSGLASFLGVTIGGFFIRHDIFPSPYIALFIMSVVLRLIAEYSIAWRFSETRPKIPEVTNKEFFLSMVGIKPLWGRDEDWNMSGEN